MLQGFERPPWWAVALMALCAVFIAVALPLALERGRVPQTGSSTAAPTSAPVPEAPVPEVPEDARVEIAVLGDAFTGSATDSGAANRWPALLAAQYPWDVTVEAYANSGFVAGAGQGRSFAERVPAIVAADPDVVVVVGGRDDLPAPPPRVEAAVDSTLRELRAGLPEARIVVVGVLWPGTAPGPVFGLDRALETSAGAVGATFLDALNDGWFDGANQALISQDGSLPTDQGHAALAQRIGDALVAAGVPAA